MDPAYDPFDRTDIISGGDLARMAATLNGPAPTSTPVFWHWTAFLDQSPTSTLGPDGHPRSAGLIAEPPFSRRMFAGGRMTLRRAFPIGVPIRRVAEVGPIVHKEGTRGPLALVTVSFDYLVDGVAVAREEQDLAYLPALQPGPSVTAEAPAMETKDRDARGPGRVGAGDAHGGGPGGADGQGIRDSDSFDEAALFRFSALTFNAHRIHYDRDFAVGTDGHPDLVVHGPLLVVRLLELVRLRWGDDSVADVRFRAKATTYVGRSLDLFARVSDGRVVLEVRDMHRSIMDAEVGLR